MWAATAASKSTAEEPQRAGFDAPSHGSSVARSVYGGAERAISLATGFLTGESTWNPPQGGADLNLLITMCYAGLSASQGGFLTKTVKSTCGMAEASLGTHPSQRRNTQCQVFAKTLNPPDNSC